jgi:drug/metabolite transporter (DMT)-like permease
MNSTSKKWLAYSCLALSMALVGAYVALSKPLVAAIPVFLLAWIRFGIAGVFMLPWLKKPATEAPLSSGTKKLLFLESFFGNFLFSICMLFGVSMTSAVSAGVILATIPAMVAILGAIFLKEKISVRVWLAIFCAAFGVALLTIAKHYTNANTADHSDTLIGNLLVFGAVVCEASYVVIGKKLTSNLNPKRISALINLWGLCLVTPFGAWWALQFEFYSVSLSIWTLLVFYAVAASIATVWLWMTGLKTIEASKAGVFTVMLPISAAVVGVLFLNEPVTWVQFVALLIGLAGVVLATLPQSNQIK